ncbi:MAG: hypothetical protein CBB97_15890 [Candidatus Endolissoclinum sp. TMED37]|nr:MAG: hypothetical protein CBB97_15890 [Candidatus Endolissoclinum sp. TMED37]
MIKEGLSIIVPVFNEEIGIENTVESLKKILKKAPFNIEIIFVNDGSTDKTADKLSIGIKGVQKIRCINHDNNHGYGASLKTGISNSKYMHIAITDADDTYPNHRLPELYDKFIKENLDMLVGARIGNKAKIPLIRRPAKWVLNKLANYLSEYRIPDLNSGLRIMKKEVIIKYFNILPSGFSFTTTITLAMLTNNYKVKYEPIDYFHRSGASKIRPIYDTLNFLQLIIRTVLLFRPLKVFLPLSLIMFFTALILIIYRFFVGEAFGVTATVIFVGAVQVLAIGMLADLIDRRLDN